MCLSWIATGWFLGLVGDEEMFLLGWQPGLLFCQQGGRIISADFGHGDGGLPGTSRLSEDGSRAK